jgi:hypothetical protein
MHATVRIGGLARLAANSKKHASTTVESPQLAAKMKYFLRNYSAVHHLSHKSGIPGSYERPKAKRHEKFS